jgi:hypothetical protein
MRWLGTAFLALSLADLFFILHAGPFFEANPFACYVWEAAGSTGLTIAKVFVALAIISVALVALWTGRRDLAVGVLSFGCGAEAVAILYAVQLWFNSRVA